MKYLKYLLCITVSLFISISFSVAQDLIAVDDNEDVDFSNFTSYTWAPVVNNTASENYISDRSLKFTIQQTIADELDARGYTRTSADPDFFVSYKVIKEEIDPLNPPEQTERSSIATLDNTGQNREFKEGTLVVQLLDRDRNTVLWQGAASGILKGDDFLSHTPSRNEGAINNEPQNEEQLKDGGVSSNEDGPTPDERAVEAIKQMFEKFEYFVRE